MLCKIQCNDQASNLFLQISNAIRIFIEVAETEKQRRYSQLLNLFYVLKVAEIGTIMPNGITQTTTTARLSYFEPVMVARGFKWMIRLRLRRSYFPASNRDNHKRF